MKHHPQIRVYISDSTCHTNIERLTLTVLVHLIGRDLCAAPHQYSSDSNVAQTVRGIDVAPYAYSSGSTCVTERKRLDVLYVTHIKLIVDASQAVRSFMFCIIHLTFIIHPVSACPTRRRGLLRSKTRTHTLTQ